MHTHLPPFLSTCTYVTLLTPLVHQAMSIPDGTEAYAKASGLLIDNKMQITDAVQNGEKNSMDQYPHEFPSTALKHRNIILETVAAGSSGTQKRNRTVTRDVNEVTSAWFMETLLQRVPLSRALLQHQTVNFRAC